MLKITREGCLSWVLVRSCRCGVSWQQQSLFLSVSAGHPLPVCHARLPDWHHAMWRWMLLDPRWKQPPVGYLGRWLYPPQVELGIPVHGTGGPFYPSDFWREHTPQKAAGTEIRRYPQDRLPKSRRESVAAIADREQEK